MPLGKPGHSGGAASPSTRGPRRLALWLPAVVGVLLIVALGGWVVERGRLLVMQTPSMGATAPAGSLVLTKPLGGAPIRRGMIVAFHVPVSGQVYMHRVAALLPNGRFRTRGDLNGSDDGWELTRSSVIGVPVAIVPDLGWVVMGLPWVLAVLAGGMLASFVLPRSVRPELRAITVGAAVALPLYIVRPFVRVAISSAERVASVPGVAAVARHLPLAINGGAAWPVSAALGPIPRAVDGGAGWPSSFFLSAGFRARLVNAGVVPVRITMHGAHTVIAPGHAGIIASHLAARAPAALEAHPVLPLWGWIVIVAVILVPVPVGLLALRETLSTEVSASPARPDVQGADGLASARKPAGEPA